MFRRSPSLVACNTDCSPLGSIICNVPEAVLEQGRNVSRGKSRENWKAATRGVSLTSPVLRVPFNVFGQVQYVQVVVVELRALLFPVSGNSYAFLRSYVILCNLPWTRYDELVGTAGGEWWLDRVRYQGSRIEYFSTDLFSLQTYDWYIKVVIKRAGEWRESALKWTDREVWVCLNVHVSTSRGRIEMKHFYFNFFQISTRKQIIPRSI